MSEKLKVLWGRGHMCPLNEFICNFLYPCLSDLCNPKGKILLDTKQEGRKEINKPPSR
jgi:hypothetical protein